jgi:hypothetical protein
VQVSRRFTKKKRMRSLERKEENKYKGEGKKIRIAFREKKNQNVRNIQL